jgi:hypothetical protein
VIRPKDRELADQLHDGFAADHAPICSRRAPAARTLAGAATGREIAASPWSRFCGDLPSQVCDATEDPGEGARERRATGSQPFPWSATLAASRAADAASDRPAARLGALGHLHVGSTTGITEATGALVACVAFGVAVSHSRGPGRPQPAGAVSMQAIGPPGGVSGSLLRRVGHPG